jgi:TorA maturation chaperone TorD
MNTHAVIWEPNRVFSLLSSLYLCTPTGAAVADWRTTLADPPQLFHPLQEALALINVDSAQELEHLLWEFTRLFIGPYRLPAPPWESVYTSPKKLMMQEAYEAVLACYREAGLEPGNPGIMADHVGVELNFVAALYEKKAADPENFAQYHAIAEQFTAEHLQNWIPRFTRDLEDACASPVYRALAVATREAFATVRSVTRIERCVM